MGTANAGVLATVSLGAGSGLFELQALRLRALSTSKDDAARLKRDIGAPETFPLQNPLPLPPVPSAILVQSRICPDGVEESCHVGHFVATPHRIADRQEVSAGLYQRRAILGRDSSDRNARQLEDRLPPFEEVESGDVLGVLGAGRKEGAEGNIVRPRLARVHGEMPAVVAGNA